jgi:outer membrane protein
MTARIVILLLAAPAFAAAQERLSLDEAVARARSNHPSAASAVVGEREAEHAADRARAAWLPRIDVLESWQRGNSPVFAFSSLLAQRRFTEQDFDVSRLNHPDAIDIFRSALSIEQIVFDGTVAPGVRAADLARERASLHRREVDQDLATAVVDAYGRVLLMDALGRAAGAAVTAAARDVQRARDRRDVGSATAADVLSLEVHAAAMREREIEAGAEARVARARLNVLVGAPLDTLFMLDLLPPAVDSPPSPSVLEARALEARPDVLLARVDERAARVAAGAARGAFLPQVAARGTWEWNGGTFTSRVSGWIVGTEIRWNLFQGFGNLARLGEAEAAVERRALERAQTENDARLAVRAALARLEGAEARRAVAQAIVSQARESGRIVRDRYENGLADVTVLLQAARAELDADAQDVSARVALVVQRAALDRAVGR